MAKSTDSEYAGDEKGHENRHKMDQANIGGIRGFWGGLGEGGYRWSKGHEKKMLMTMTKMPTVMRLGISPVSGGLKKVTVMTMLMTMTKMMRVGISPADKTFSPERRYYLKAMSSKK